MTIAPAATRRGPRRPNEQARDARARRERREHQRRVADVALVVAALGYGATLGSMVVNESIGSLRAAGGVLMAIGRVAGLSGSYLMLVMLVLMARVPALERAVGQEQLARWHRRIGGWPIALITLHVIFVTLGYAEASHSGVWQQILTFINHYPDLLAAMVAFALLVGVGIASWRAARTRMRYETWWAIHLYTYLALALGFAHQLATGVSFITHPLARALWATAWALAAGSVVAFRIAAPLLRSARHRLRVVEVREEAPGVVSVVCRGRALERLHVDGGQFFQWRFLERGLWWQAHPYSLSALPSPPFLRVTVRSLGDHSGSLATLRPGTRVAIEGPYGQFVASRRQGDGVLLVGAGVGVTPLRALLESLPKHVDVSVIVRGSAAESLVLHDELESLVEARRGKLHTVLGPRDSVRFDERFLRRLVPDVAQRDVFVCGPADFADHLVRALARLGVPRERIHRETFAF